MGKARKALKLASAGAVTAVYGVAAYVAWTKDTPAARTLAERREVVIVASVLASLTWIAVLA